MSQWQLKTPVVFIIFKRPETTQKVFDVIRQAKPPQLLVIADGHRIDRPGEAEQCAATRTIIDCVDWDCEVLKNYSEINLGCAKRVASGLDWVFNTVEEAIILEDDCVPHPTFFRFCEELLNRYRHDQRITSISGQNVQFGQKRTEYSYYFSRYQHCWGWATWKRAWQYFNFDEQLWSNVLELDLLTEILGEAQAVRAWRKNFQSTYSGKIDTWDTRWMLSCWVQSGLSIISNVNLVSNIGFGNQSTNANQKKSRYSQMPVEEMNFPLNHPPFIIRNRAADNFTQNTLFDYSPTLLKRIARKIKLIATY